MRRGLLAWILLIPLLSNGLWIVCGDSSEPTASADSLNQSEKDCVRICLMKHAAELGAICLVLPGNAKNSASITVIDVGVAVLPLEFSVSPASADVPLVITSSASYAAPSLPNETPPPKSGFCLSV
jgi:hypothetical protein